ncbi:Dolichyl-diphosphooligosaccharide--protein glycosyltransferase 48 kDa subunit [Neoconidiobolus thromboides FSU 785]|nr:Dolichyl-diphosphooligosaccharide--protein glycosyltransferase 48 kDa subunit [Neoconidiobolus thromboides FSU 785]
MKLLNFSAISILISGIASSLSYSGNKVLFIGDNDFVMEDYSQFISSLKDRDYDITFVKAQEEDVKLMNFETKNYDHLILFSPKVTAYGGGLSEKEIIEFVDQGGNLLLAANNDLSKLYQNVAYQFGVQFDVKGSKVLDPFNYNVVNNDDEDHEYILSEDINYSNYFSEEYKIQAPILFKGVGHSINNSNNNKVRSILKSTVSSFSLKPSSSDTTSLFGHEISLISALQTSNNARVTIFGSTEMFSDKFVNDKIIKKLNNGEKSAAIDSDNLNFIKQITKWNFQEFGVIKCMGINHHRINEVEAPSNYRINDEIKYSIKLAEYSNNTWLPFQKKDIQLEIIMLDPYIRTYLAFEKVETDKDGNSYSIYSTQVKLPDVYGVFTFKVDYQREGFSYIFEKNVVPVHPFRHNEYPRFLTPAFPYYLSTASMGISFVLFSIIWLFYKEDLTPSKKKNQ